MKQGIFSGTATKRALICGILLITAVVLAYGSAVRSDFVNWDDGILVFENSMAQELTPISIQWAFTHFDPELYIPLTFLTYQAESAIFGLNPHIFHLTNLLLHLANVLLVFGIFLLLTKRRWMAFFCALLFGLHPINTEAVMWISARKDLLASFFFLISLFAYLLARSSGSVRAFISSIVLFLLALLSKVSVVVLPIVLLLIDYRQEGRISRRDIVSKWPYFLLSVIFGCVAIFGKARNIESLSPFSTALLASKSTVSSLSKLLYPVKFSVFYQYMGSIPLEPADFVWYIIILLIIAAVVLYSIKWTKEILFGCFFFGLLLAPSFVTFYKQDELFFASDRYVYLASIGIIFTVIWAVFRLQEKMAGCKIFVAPVFLGILAVGLGVRAHTQTGAWRDTQALYENAATAYPEMFFPQHNLGALYLDQGEIDKAIVHLKKAIEIDPSRAMAYTNLGVAYGKKGMYEEGLQYLLKGLELDPNSAEKFKDARDMIEGAGR